ncbi:GNAT family N-acetyltransferase [Paenibacillus donghaensis]|uniref:GNAT family N-acetyltransferase n=1 Tax=Paenibacillus donghaensis TaxID=414771 RepID=A0A2Z2KSD2_9BACL|nr:N-acetyltransferase [Paenibacillus donghaensis]ASA25809.1 GNAT family N-acetyltransferase [Paenibacillus donghaensis]
MITTPIIIETMHSQYNQAVSRLLVDGFRGKFQTLTKLNDDKLALFFEKLLIHFPDEAGGQRVVAMQNGEAVGTMALKWKPESSVDSQAQHRASWQDFNKFGKWNLLKLLLGLHYLAHQPKERECYIADISVQPHHRGKGVGKQLLEWAQHNMQTLPLVDHLSLHVSANNQRAKQLYEQLSFRSCSKKNSIMRSLLFNEYEWDYMIFRSRHNI